MGSSRELVKLYYRIGEVSQIVGVQPHVLRYWETEFRTIRPQKSHKGQRVYSRRDVEKLLKVKDLLKNQGFTIAGAKKKLRDPDAQVSVEAELEPVVEQAVAPKASAPALPARDPMREQMREALLALRADIASMLDDLGAPPRRPKIPSIP
ncbi:MAG TPA: MerR family transcriptional regulator [Polyangiaceae bacterium]|nr:MerR family transcriptional regulator [Polyangiaceae bacterium]